MFWTVKTNYGKLPTKVASLVLITCLIVPVTVTLSKRVKKENPTQATHGARARCDKLVSTVRKNAGDVMQLKT